MARAQTLAEKEGKEPLIGLQLEYSLAERNIEREHLPVAQELGIGIVRGARSLAAFSVENIGEKETLVEAKGGLTRRSTPNLQTDLPSTTGVCWMFFSM